MYKHAGYLRPLAPTIGAFIYHHLISGEQKVSQHPGIIFLFRCAVTGGVASAGIRILDLLWSQLYIRLRPGLSILVYAEGRFMMHSITLECSRVY